MAFREVSKHGAFNLLKKIIRDSTFGKIGNSLKFGIAVNLRTCVADEHTIYFRLNQILGLANKIQFGLMLIKD